MTEEPEWERVGGPSGTMVRWKDVGQSLLGVWVGRVQDAKFPTGIVEQEGEEIAFAMPTVLVDRFAAIPVGTLVKVVFLGLQKSKSMRSFQSFDVFVPKGTKLIEEEVPF